MSNNSKIKILNSDTQEILYEYAIAEADQAYQQAAQLEELGLDIIVDHPNVTETLCDSLGLNAAEQEDYQESVVAEIADHDGSCCHTPVQ